MGEITDTDLLDMADDIVARVAQITIPVNGRTMREILLDMAQQHGLIETNNETKEADDD